VVRTGVERLATVPGVVVASAACCVPLEGGYGLPFIISGRPLTEGPFHGNGGWLTVSPGYFDVFQIAVRQGRVMTDRDTAAAPAVVVINETMARRYWADANPVGQRLIIGRGVMREFAEEPEREIIGVVSDVRDDVLSSDPEPQMYIPQAQVPDAVNALNVKISRLAWVVRTETDPFGLRAPIEEALRQATGLPVADVRSMAQVVSRSTSRERFNMWLMTLFGGTALLLSAIGIYGLIAYTVQNRTQEIGVRLALGAQTSQVRRMVMLQGLKLAAIGVAVGMAGAFALARLIASFLFGVPSWDPAVFLSAPVLLGAVAALATWLPARRASRVDPIQALRYE
jgi:predicted permease